MTQRRAVPTAAAEPTARPPSWVEPAVRCCHPVAAHRAIERRSAVPAAAAEPTARRLSWVELAVRCCHPVAAHRATERRLAVPGTAERTAGQPRGPDPAAPSGR